MLTIAEQGYFFVGGSYTKTSDGRIMTGQMYVQYQIPAEPHAALSRRDVARRRPDRHQLHGYAGRPQGLGRLLPPARLRGLHRRPAGTRAIGLFHRDLREDAAADHAARCASRFTAPERASMYPQAKLHTQWPGTGMPGDPVFDQFFASQVEDIADLGMIERLNRDAGIALLDKDRPGDPAHALAVGTVRMAARGCAPEARQRDSRDRAQRSAVPREHDDGIAGLVQGRRDRAAVGHHARAADLFARCDRSRRTCG